MQYIHIPFFLYLIWRYIFRNRTVFPKATILQKIIHAAVLFYIALICWERLFVASQIILETHHWLDSLNNAQHPYPMWIDAVLQIMEAIIGPIGLICCYFMLKGRERARQVFLIILPFIYVFDCYRGVAISLRLYHVNPISFIMILGSIMAVPYAVIFIFYSRSRLITALFNGANLHRE